MTKDHAHSIRQAHALADYLEHLARLLRQPETPEKLASYYARGWTDDSLMQACIDDLPARCRRIVDATK